MAKVKKADHEEDQNTEDKETEGTNEVHEEEDKDQAPDKETESIEHASPIQEYRTPNLEGEESHSPARDAHQ